MSKTTILSLILSALRNAPDGLTSSQIICHVQEKRPGTTETTISHTISDGIENGKIEKSGLRAGGGKNRVRVYVLKGKI